MARNQQAILVVDDRPANLIAMAHTLNEAGVKIVTAQNGEQALAATLDQDFALAILDVQMPGMDGFELAELMRGNPEAHSMPIVFLTAFSAEDWQVFKGYESGAVDYIIKPSTRISCFPRFGCFWRCMPRNANWKTASASCPR